MKKRYQDKYGIDEQRIVHMTSIDILLLNHVLQEIIISYLNFLFFALYFIMFIGVINELDC